MSDILIYVEKSDEWFPIDPCYLDLTEHDAKITEKVAKEILQSLEVLKASLEWDYPLDYQVAIEMAMETIRDRYE